MRLAAFTVMALASAWMVWQVSILTNLNPARDIEVSIARMMRGTALWVASVALVLVSLRGWDLVPAAMVLIAVAVVCWFLPKP